MIKYTWIKRTLAKATPLQREIATKHYRELQRKYDLQVKPYRELYSNRSISLTTYRKATKEPLQALCLELKGVLKVVVSNYDRG